MPVGLNRFFIFSSYSFSRRNSSTNLYIRYSLLSELVRSLDSLTFNIQVAHLNNALLTDWPLSLNLNLDIWQFMLLTDDLNFVLLVVQR